MYLKNYIAAVYNINVQENISDFLKSLIKGDWRNSYSGEWCGPWASNANVTSMLIRLKFFRKIKKTNTISSVSKLFCILYLSFSSFEKWTLVKTSGSNFDICLGFGMKLFCRNIEIHFGNFVFNIYMLKSTSVRKVIIDYGSDWL